MKKSLVGLTDRQQDYLRKVSVCKGISLAELVRRVLDEHIDAKLEKIRSERPDAPDNYVEKLLITS